MNWYNAINLNLCQGLQICAAKEGLLNAYENGCSKYIDNKIDKERFKKIYLVEIRNIVEDKSFKDKFDSNTSRYKAILKVYKEWNDLEK